MRRLQANLSYMASLADRKPDTKPAPCPAYLTAPQLTLTVKLRAQPIIPEGTDIQIDPVTDREERAEAIKELYTRLQACFPGIDPTKEPTFRPAQPGMPGGPGAGAGTPQQLQHQHMMQQKMQQQQHQQHMMSQASPTHKTPQMGHMAAPPTGP